MFCPECRCEFVGWTGRCPGCKTPLVEEALSVPGGAHEPIPYEALVELVREHGGQLRIDLSTIEVGKERKWRFPYLGYGRAWAKRMRGTCNGVLVDLVTTEVGRGRKWGFPYLGYGFGWARAMRGDIGGNEVVLTATKVAMEKKWGFPYLGYGFGWTQEMSGECGVQLAIDLSTTDVGRQTRWRFPYLGYGFAWARKSTLALTLKQ
jgi:hypothetical protein